MASYGTISPVIWWFNLDHFKCIYILGSFYYVGFHTIPHEYPLILGVSPHNLSFISFFSIPHWSILLFKSPASSILTVPLPFPSEIYQFPLVDNSICNLWGYMDYSLIIIVLTSDIYLIANTCHIGLSWSWCFIIAN